MTTDSSVTMGTSAIAARSAVRWWILVTVGLAQLMVVLDATIVNIALPSAQAELGFSNTDRQWVITAYSLAFGSLLLLGGRLSDLIGRKQSFMIGLVGFAGSSALAGAAGSFGLLVAARALQGGFGALLAPAGLALLTTTFTAPKESQRALGIWAGIAGAGGAVGLLLGGALTQSFGWRWNLYVNVFFAIIALIGAIALIRNQPRTAPRPRLDVLGTVLIAGGMFGVVYGFSNSAQHGWSSPLTWGFLIGAGILIGLFGLWQRRAANPLLPLAIILNRTRGAAFISLLIAGASMLGLFLFLTYYLQVQRSYSPLQSGLAFLPLIVALILASGVTSNRLAPRFGPKVIIPIGMLFAAGGMVYLTQVSLTTGYLGGVLPALILMGLGVGATFATGVGAITRDVDPRYAGVASSLVSTSQQMGGSIGTAVLNSLAASAATAYVASHLPSSAHSIALAQLESYSTAFWWAAGFLAGGAVLTAFLYQRQPRQAGVVAVETTINESTNAS
jgi:EmrB/QacA subfamily drug resistance transporter